MSGHPTVVFVDHSFHRVTGSSRFFSDILKRTAKVVELDCEGWRGGPKVSAEDVDAVGADLVVFWQTLPYLTDMLELRTPAVWVPMYDSAAHRTAMYWGVLSRTRVRILSFCRALSYRARRYGIPVSDYTYYPDPSQLPRMKLDLPGIRVFLWDRGDVGWDELRALIGRQHVERTILRTAPDPGLQASRVTLQDRDAYNIRLIAGPLPREQHLELLSTCNVFIAPRRVEGIGMAFLEAMAMGLAVVAPDGPTMNEYITHLVNGYLYDPLRPGQVELSGSAAVGLQARRSVVQGRQDWLASTGGLTDDLLATPLRPAVRSRDTLVLARLLTAGERAKDLVPPRRRAALSTIRRGASRRRR